MLVPDELARLEIFCLRSPGHPGGSKLVTKTNQCKISSGGDLRAREGPKDLLHHSQVLPDNETFKAFSFFTILIITHIGMGLKQGDANFDK